MTYVYLHLNATVYFGGLLSTFLESSCFCEAEYVCLIANGYKIYI